MADYPADWERVARTHDGVGYRIRPIKPEDERREREFIVGLSPDSRYKRLMSTMREPPDELVWRFVHVDYSSDMAFVALVGAPPDEHIIGVSRYAADGPGPDREFAIVVADAWQARGVGATLLRLLFEYAKTQGIEKMHGKTLASNSRMVELVHWLGMDSRLSPEDSAILDASREL